MIFIGVALLIAVVLALVISSGAGDLVGLTETQTGQLIPLLLILVVVAGGAFGQRRRLGQMAMGLVLWAGIFGLTFVGYAYRAELSGVAARVLGELSPGVAVVDSQKGSAVFQRSFSGGFRVNGTVNGASMTMIFDTGADSVVLTNADAREAGLKPENLRYTVPVQTANGTGRAARVTLDRIEVGGIMRTRISAFVAAEGALDTSLLGMSYLDTLSGFAVSRNVLELRD